MSSKLQARHQHEKMFQLAIVVFNLHFPQERQLMIERLHGSDGRMQRMFFQFSYCLFPMFSKRGKLQPTGWI